MVRSVIDKHTAMAIQCHKDQYIYVQTLGTKLLGQTYLLHMLVGYLRGILYKYLQP